MTRGAKQGPYAPAVGGQSRSATRAEGLRRQIADAIITGRLAPGSRLDEQDLAKAYGLSRTPVREALRQLTSMGLAQHRPHRGVIVAEMSLEKLSQSFELMADLESLCARYAALRMSPAERQDLAALHRKSAELVRVGDPELYANLNKQFHAAIYRGAHNEALEEATLAIRQRVAPYRRGQFRLLGRLGDSFAEHQKVVEAIEQGNADLAARAMFAHVAIVSAASTAYSASGEAMERKPQATAAR